MSLLFILSIIICVKWFHLDLSPTHLLSSLAHSLISHTNEFNAEPKVWVPSCYSSQRDCQEPPKSPHFDRGRVEGYWSAAKQRLGTLCLSQVKLSTRVIDSLKMPHVWDPSSHRLFHLIWFPFCLPLINLHPSKQQIWTKQNRPEPHILLFRRPLGTDPNSGEVDPELEREAKERYQQELIINQRK